MINAAIVAGIAFRTISARFQIGYGSLKRHAEAHVPEYLSKAKDAEDVLNATKLLKRSVQRKQKIEELFDKVAGTTEEASMALAASREARGHDELLLKATGAWRERLGIDLSGQVQLSPAERSDGDALVFLHERYPEVEKEFLGWAAAKLKEELGGDAGGH